MHTGSRTAYYTMHTNHRTGGIAGGPGVANQLFDLFYMKPTGRKSARNGKSLFARQERLLAMVPYQTVTRITAIIAKNV